MKRVLGILAVVGLVMATIAVADQRGEVLSQRRVSAGTSAVAGAELIVVPTSMGDKAQMLTVIDPRQHVLCVYHIDLATGKIALKSVRNIHWDLQISDLNNENPLPREIQSLLEQK